MDLAGILDFVDSGHDLIIAADSAASDLIRDIATECGVDFDEVSINIFNEYSFIISDWVGWAMFRICSYFLGTVWFTESEKRIWSVGPCCLGHR